MLSLARWEHYDPSIESGRPRSASDCRVVAAIFEPPKPPPVAWFQAIFMLTQAKRGFPRCGRIARGKIPFVVAVRQAHRDRGLSQIGDQKRAGQHLIAERIYFPGFSRQFLAVAALFRPPRSRARTRISASTASISAVSLVPNK